MAVPKFQAIMLPTLQVLKDGRARAAKELNDELAQYFKLTRDDLSEVMASGQTLFYNRAAWAKLHLSKAGLIHYPQRGVAEITALGLDYLATNPTELRLRDLKQFPLYNVWRDRKSSTSSDAETKVQGTEEDDEPAAPPNELLDDAFVQIQDTLASEIVDRIHQVSPEFFEKLVLDVLIAMGYGGSQAEAQEHVGRAGDGGIDGIIREDRLGLDMIYVQAKRWERNIGRPDIQQFVGALQGHRARKGVFITTSTFSREARDYAAALDVRVSLIDGTTLARLMIEHNVGVSVERVYQVKRMDSDYFEEQ